MPRRPCLNEERTTGMRRVRGAAVALTTALVLAACSGGAEEPDGDDPSVPAEDGGAAAGGGTITVAIGATASRGLDPANIANFTPSSEGNFLPAIFGMLAYLDAETGDVVPDLAESLEPSDDGSVWTVTLRPGLEFSDGTPLDAERSEEHTSELQSRGHLVCRLLLEKTTHT